MTTKNKIIFSLMFSLILIITAKANSGDTTKVNVGRLAIIGGGTVAFFTYGYIIQNNIWWKNEKTNFHFNNVQDYKYALNADKLGHFYFAYLATNIYSDLFMWAGINKRTALLYGGLVAFTFHTFTEIRDGFSAGYGFSWGDLAADFVGAAYPALQNYYSALQPFDFKISFYPSQKFKAGEYATVLDDYESTYHWLTINITGLLPQRAKKYFPDFINVAIGHSVKNLNGIGGGNHELFLSLDWDFEALPGENKFWKSVKRILNYYHFPAPAIKIYPNIVWYGLKF